MPTGLAAVYRAAYGFKQGLAARESIIIARMARQWMTVQDRLWREIEALAAEFAKLESPSMAKLFQMQRYQSLVMQIREQTELYNAWLVPAIAKEQRYMATLAQKQAGAAFRAWGIGGAFDVIEPGAVEAMVGIAANGAPLVTLLQKAWPLAIDKLMQALINGTALGWNPRKTAREMMIGVDAGLNRMMTIARTEQIRAYRVATLGRYRSSGLVSGYRRVAAKQERTCVACLLEDGKFYELSIEFEDHTAGRCTLVPIPWGHEDDPLGRESGRQWFEKLDADAQQRIMGTGKWQAWQAGKFGLDDLVKRTYSPEWGTSIGVASLGSLT